MRDVGLSLCWCSCTFSRLEIQPDMMVACTMRMKKWGGGAVCVCREWVTDYIIRVVVTIIKRKRMTPARLQQADVTQVIVENNIVDS